MNPNKKLLTATLELLACHPYGLNQYEIFDKLETGTLRSTTFTRYLRHWKKEGYIISFYRQYENGMRGAWYMLPYGERLPVCMPKEPTFLQKLINFFR
jgi:hypothetical protein